MPEDVKIAIGVGATVSIGSDCYPATIIHVDARSISVQMDHATEAEGYDYYQNQVHDFAPNPKGEIKVFTLRRGGRYAELGSPVGRGYNLQIGERRQYRDPDF